MVNVKLAKRSSPLLFKTFYFLEIYKQINKRQHDTLTSRQIEQFDLLVKEKTRETEVMETRQLPKPFLGRRCHSSSNGSADTRYSTVQCTHPMKAYTALFYTCHC